MLRRYVCLVPSVEESLSESRHQWQLCFNKDSGGFIHRRGDFHPIERLLKKRLRWSKLDWNSRRQTAVDNLLFQCSTFFIALLSAFGILWHLCLVLQHIVWQERHFKRRLASNGRRHLVRFSPRIVLGMLHDLRSLELDNLSWRLHLLLHNDWTVEEFSKL